MAYIPLESWSANLGKSVGTGITDVLGNIAKDKVNQMNRENFRKQWGEHGAGYKPHEVDLLWEARQNPSIAKSFSTLLGAFGPGASQQLQQEQAKSQQQYGQPQQQEPTRGSSFMQQGNPAFEARQAIAQQPGLASLLGQPNASAALMQNPAIAQLMGMGGLGQGQMPNATRELGLNRVPLQQPQQQARPAVAPQQMSQMAQPVQPQQYFDQPQSAPLTDRQRYSQSLGKTSALDSKQQAAIDRVEAPYLKRLESKKDSLREIVDKAGKMKQLLEEGGDDESQVSSGWTGYLSPTRTLGSASEQFSNLSDDVAAALTGLSSGVQTISKIKFNQQRKPNLGQNRLTQEERTEDLLDYGKKGLLEQDLTDYLIEKNDNNTPKALSKTVNQVYSKLERNIPPVPQGAQEGQLFNDNKNKVQWRVDGPIMRFNGFIGE